MNHDNARPGQLYWSLIEPITGLIDALRDDVLFMQEYHQVAPEAGHLFAAHYCQAEVRNGGFYQFFSNSTGVLAPEALEAFQAMGLVEWADSLAEAMRFFGEPYPRAQFERADLLPRKTDPVREEWDPFWNLDEKFYRWRRVERYRFQRAADEYAKRIKA